MSINILVTGANGFLASHLVSVLLEKGGVSICGTYRKDTSRLIQDPPARLVYERCDLSEASDVMGLFKKYRFDAVIHTAGAISTRNDYDYMKQSIRDNIASQVNAGSEAMKSGCKLYIFCSSMAVYGDSAERSDGFREEDALHPCDVYGWSKRAAEEVLRIQAEREKKMRGIVLRLAGIHGAGRQGGVVYNIAQSAISGKEIVIDEPESRFRFLFVRDAVQAIMLSLFSKPAAYYRCYNVSGEEILTLNGLAQQIFEITGCTMHINYNKEGRTRNRVLNIDRIKKELKFEPKTLKENLKSMVSGMKNEKACVLWRTGHE